MPEQVFNLNDMSTPSGTMTLNGGQATASSSPVTIDSSQVSGAAWMRTSTDDTNWTGWSPYVTNSLVALPGLPGPKSVFVQYRAWGGGVMQWHRMVTLAATQFTAGANHALALKADGSLYAWGWNVYGQLGDGTTTDQHSPESIGTGYAAIAAGSGHTLALKADGSLYAWGWNYYGQLGDGTTTSQHSPKLISTGYVAIAAGSNHTLALKADGSLYGMGRQHLLPARRRHERPVSCSPELIGAGYVAMAAAGEHSLALKADGSLCAWGNNYYGQLGDGHD